MILIFDKNTGAKTPKIKCLFQLNLRCLAILRALFGLYFQEQHSAPWNPASKATYLCKLTAVALLQNNIPTAQKKALKTLIEIEDMALLLAFLNLYQHAKTQLNSSHQS